MVGFSEFPKAKKTLDDAVKQGVAPGFVAGVWRREFPDSMSLMAVGSRRLKLKGLSQEPMQIDTVFDLASVSKVFTTATLIARLVDRGWISYETRIGSVFSSFKIPNATVANLLSHTAGLPAWVPFFEQMREIYSGRALETVPVAERQKLMRELVFKVDPERGLNQKAVYSDLTFMILGFLIEEVTQMDFDQAIKKFLWEPMGLLEKKGEGPFFVRTDRASFKARLENVAATEDCPWRGSILQGQVHDDNCWAMGGFAGHAGAFGSARDLLIFSKKLLQDRWLTPETLNRMWARVTEPPNCDRTLGWDTPSGETPALGRYFSSSSVGHLGFTGTSLWIDPQAGVAVTLLSNRVHPTRDNILIRELRREFHEALAVDLNLTSRHN
jgi:CubicO group peptidase (beta-lactamase class C family)